MDRRADLKAVSENPKTTCVRLKHRGLGRLNGEDYHTPTWSVNMLSDCHLPFNSTPFFVSVNEILFLTEMFLMA